MNFRKLLLQEHSKAQKNRIADLIGDDPVRFKELWEIVQSKEPPLPQRAAWVLDECARRNPDLIIPHMGEFVEQLRLPGHDAVKRGLIKSLSWVDIPEEIEGELYALCIDWTGNPQVAIAVRVFSMEVAWNIAQKYPELMEELGLVIEAHLPFGSAGFKSRGKKILRKINEQIR